MIKRFNIVTDVPVFKLRGHLRFSYAVSADEPLSHGTVHNGGEITLESGGFAVYTTNI